MVRDADLCVCVECSFWANMFLAQLFDVGGARHPSIAIDSGGLLATVGWSQYYMDSHTGADYTSLQAVPCNN